MIRHASLFRSYLKIKLIIHKNKTSHNILNQLYNLDGTHKRTMESDRAHNYSNCTTERPARPKNTTANGYWKPTTTPSILRTPPACGYKGLMINERCFCSLKRTQIKMSPMYHWLPRRIETHVRICVLALLIERVAEIVCQKPWSQIRAILEGLKASEFETPIHRFFKLNEASEPLSDTLKLLRIPLPTGVLGLRPSLEEQ